MLPLVNGCGITVLVRMLLLTASLESYLRWDDVGAVALVELLYAIETA